MADIKINGVTYPAKKRAVLPGVNGEPQVFELPEEPDAELNNYSENAVQNKVIAAAIRSVREQIASPFDAGKDVADLTELEAIENPAKNEAHYVHSEKCWYAWTGEEWAVASMSEADYMEQLTDIKSAFFQTNQYNVIPFSFIGRNITKDGITYVFPDKSTCQVSGVANALSSESVVISYNSFPYGIEAGKSYSVHVDGATPTVFLRVMLLNGNSVVSNHKVIEDAVVTIPDSGVNGIVIRIEVSRGATVNNMIRFGFVAHGAVDDLRAQVDDQNNTINEKLYGLHNQVFTSELMTWIQGAIKSTGDTRLTAIKTRLGYLATGPAMLTISNITDGYKLLGVRLSGEPHDNIYPTTGWNTGWKTNTEDIILAPNYYYAFQIEKTDGSAITPEDNADVDFKFYAVNDSFQLGLVVCGYDASDVQKRIGEKMERGGLGYVCKSSEEIDDNINSFLDKYINVRCTVYFFGTIRTTEGVHKHPRHSLIGYGCTLMMADNAGQAYRSCVLPTSGGRTFEQAQIISHIGTIIAGFVLDGNADNNKDGDNYVYKGIYGGLICPEIYNDEEYPYARTQLITDIKMRDITAQNSMRGIIMGINWSLENAKILSAFTDHALYLAGADHAIVNNVRISGTHRGGAIAISGQSWDMERTVTGIRLSNISLINCVGSPFITIRGHFSDWGNDRTLDDVIISNVDVINDSPTTNNVMVIGQPASDPFDDPNNYDNYPHRIVVNGMYIRGNFINNLFRVQNACVVFNDLFVELTGYRPVRPVFWITPCNVCRKMLTLNHFRFRVLASQQDTEYALFGFNNSYQNHLTMHGLNLSDAVIDGISNYALFDIFEGASSNAVKVKDFVYDHVIFNPSTKIKSNLITVEEEEYFSL